MPPRSDNINALLLRLQALGGTAHCQAVVDAVPQLVTCIKSGNAAAVRQAAFLLCNLPVTGGCTACTALVQAGAVPVMLRALQRSQDDSILEAAAGMLNNLQRHGSSAETAAAAAAAFEALPQLLRLARQVGSDSQIAAGRTLFTLLRWPQYRDAVFGALHSTLPPGFAIPGALCMPPAMPPSYDPSLVAYVFNVLQLAATAPSSSAPKPAESKPPAATPSPAAPAAPPAAPQPQPATPSPAVPAAVAEPHAPRVCAACGNTSGVLRRCSACRAVRYCGEACSHAHWRVHKAECRRLRAQRAEAVQSSG